MSKHPQLLLIGAKIRKLREECGLSQEEAAHQIGLDRTYFAGIERGERNVSALNLIKVARGLEVEVGELFPPVARITSATGR